MPISILRLAGTRRALAICAIFLGTAARIAGADDGVVEPPSQLQINLRIYGGATGSQADLPMARGYVEASFHGTGILIGWVLCDDPDRVPSPCQTPLDASELIVRILSPRESVERRLITLGVSIVEAGGGQLSTVYADRVLALARRAGVAPGPVLGRAIAHEIGHLLLGTATHAATGLMRESWSRRELHRNEQGDWLFSAEEITAVRAGVAMRLARTALASR